MREIFSDKLCSKDLGAADASLEREPPDMGDSVGSGGQGPREVPGALGDRDLRDGRSSNNNNDDVIDVDGDESIPRKPPN